MSAKPQAVSPPTEVRILPLASIVESKTNPRRTHDSAAHLELAASIAKVGVLSPVLVRKAGKGYELVAGHRRFRAAQEAGVVDIPAIVKKLTNAEVLEVQLIENKHRSDIPPLEEARALARLMGQPGYTVDVVAQRIGLSTKYVYDRIKLCSLIPKAQELVADGTLTAGHAILIARLSPKQQKDAIESHEVLQYDRRLVDPIKERYSGVGGPKKACSVRELDAWIAKNVRFERKAADQMIFPETVAAVGAQEKAGGKIVPISYDYMLTPGLKGAERTLCVTSWKRADGQEKSKTCERSILGVVAVGFGYGEAFQVCTDKEGCSTHWGAWQKERKARAAGGTKAKKAADRYKVAHDAQQRRWDAENLLRERWNKAAPKMLEALEPKILKAAVRPGSPVATYAIAGGRGPVKLRPWRTAEELVRALCLQHIKDRLEWGTNFEQGPKFLRAFGLDPKRLLDEYAPEPKPAEAAS